MSIGKVWKVSPDGITTVAGTVASGLLLARATVNPPLGAGEVSVIVPWTGTPAIDTPVERKTLCSAAAVTTVVVSVAAWLAVAYVAVIVVDAATAVVVIGKEKVLLPAGMVTLAGTTAAALLLTSVTTAPPVGAATVRVRTPVTGVPPETVLDDSTMLASATAVGAVTAVESAQPDAARAVRSTRPHSCLFTSSIVASKPRPPCDSRMANA